MPGLFVNIDTDDCGGRFLNRLTDENEKPDESDLYPFIDQYAGSGVTDVLLCLGGQYSFPESCVLSDSIFKYEQKIENGLPVDYREKFRGAYRMYKVHGIDPIKVWTGRCRSVGLRPWISFRMNDRHCSRDDTSDQRPTLFYTAKENGWMLGEKYGAYRTCMNFAVPEIRRIWLEFIEEQLSKYDVCGVELDFQREIHCLRYLDDPECHTVMTEFIRAVRRVIDKYSEQKGYKIKLGCRLMRDIGQNLAFGFDAVTWDKEGLVDLIVVTPRWECCDSDMPIKEWKDLLSNTEIYAGLETLIRFDGGLYHATAEVLRGYTNRYLSDRADGMYLFNYYPVPGDRSEYGREQLERCTEVFRTCGDRRTATDSPMRYIVTRQDIAPKGYAAYEPLPIILNGEEKRLDVRVGHLHTRHKVSLTVGFDGINPDNASIHANGKLLKDPIRYMPRPEAFCGNEGCGYVPKGSRTFRFSVDTCEDGNYELVFIGNKGSITYLEFEIDPKICRS